VLKLARASRIVIGFSFMISIVYNIAGLFFAVQGIMRPMIAAMLMPCSTLTIVIITGGLSSIIAKSLGLSLKNNDL
jgi:Cu+-exporting ATPase